MFRNLLIILFILSIGLVSCADPVKIKKRDNKTDNSTNKPGDNSTPDNGTTADNSTKEDFFVDESKPPMNGDNVDVSEEMLRPFPKDNYTSPYNYEISGDTLIVDGVQNFPDPSLSKTDDCSKAFYDSLTKDIFEYNNKIYLTNRKHINEFNQIFGKDKNTPNDTRPGYEVDSSHKTYILVKDINLCKSANGVPAFIPIGRPVDGTPGMTSWHFWATFDGNNHIVENLLINYNNADIFNCVGFICALKGALSAGKLQNIGVAGEINITANWGSNKYDGAGLIGYTDGGDIKNVVSNINITGLDDVGGIVGVVATSEIQNGSAKPATIINVKNYGKIVGRSNVGGVVGFAKNGNKADDKKAKNVYKGVVNWGTVTANPSTSTTIGGLFGTYENHEGMKPISCKNGGKPTVLFGSSSTIQFTCD